MTPAQQAQQNNRTRDGKYAQRQGADPGQLALDTPETQLTDWQTKFSTPNYVPHDPATPRVEEQLRDLDGDEPTVDLWGHALSRGGFYRNHTGSPLVTDPTGATDAYGNPKFLVYGSPSSAAIKSNQDSLTSWKLRMLSSAYLADPDFNQWALDQFSRIQEPTEVVGPRGGVTKVYDDPDFAERAVHDRVVDEAARVAGTHLAADRGTVLHWVSEHVDRNTDWSHGVPVAQQVGLESPQLAVYADAYQQFTHRHGLRPILVEVPLVNDRARKAGTADRLVQLDKPLHYTDPYGERRTIPAGTRLIADIKTGKSYSKTTGRGNSRQRVPAYRGGYAAQMSTYAESVPYDRVTGRRNQWPDNIPPHQELGLIIQVESDSVRDNTPRFELEVVNLVMGRQYVDASNELTRVERAADRAAVYAT